MYFPLRIKTLKKKDVKRKKKDRYEVEKHILSHKIDIEMKLYFLIRNYDSLFPSDY